MRNLEHDAELSATHASSLFSLIGNCLLLELDHAAVELLRAPEISDALNKLDDRCHSYLHRSWSEADYEEAAAEYCALFVLPKGVTQCASYWISGSTEENANAIVTGVRTILTDFGLALHETEMGRIPEDNAGLLLLLAGQLYEMDATEDSQHGDVFVEQYIAPWARSFCAALAGKTDNPVYLAMAALLMECLGSRRRTLPTVG